MRMSPCRSCQRLDCLRLICEVSLDPLGNPCASETMMVRCSCGRTGPSFMGAPRSVALEAIKGWNKENP